MSTPISKEERDKLVDQRMEQMKLKNERLRQRQQEIEDEKKAMGSAAAPPTLVQGTSGWREPDAGDAQGEMPVTHSRAAEWPGEKPPEAPGSSWDDNRSERAHRGSSRGQRGVYRGYHNQRSAPLSPPANTAAPVDPATPAENWDEVTPTTTPPHNTSTPRGREVHAGSGRLPARSGYRGGGADRGGRGGSRGGASPSYEATRKQNFAAYEEEMKNQGGDRSGNFLMDGFRDGQRNSERTNEDSRGEGGARMNRHPRNYGGGGDQVDLRQKIKSQRHSQGGGNQQFNPEVSMTGRERHEHSKWKEDRSVCDRQRIERAKKGDGQWARPWDNGKAGPNDPPELDIYKGSDNKRLSSGESPAMRGVGQSTTSAKGRGRGRGRATHRKSSQGEHADTHRHVDANQPNLTVTVQSGGDKSQFADSTAGTQPKPVQTPNQPASATKAKSSPQAKGTPAKASHKQTDVSVLNISSGSEEQEIIITEEDDEDGWVDMDSDEEFYAEEEEVTPHVSKEPTPARSNQSMSKESTPVPADMSATTSGSVATSGSAPAADSTDASHNTKSGTSQSTPADSNQSTPAAKSSNSEAPAKAEAAKRNEAPAKAGLHIDIRDPVNEEEIVDILRTPEGGREKIDWAAEMEAESPATEGPPNVKLNS